MLDHYRMFADYNRWANRRVYAAVSELSDRNTGKTRERSSARCTGR